MRFASIHVVESVADQDAVRIATIEYEQEAFLFAVVDAVAAIIRLTRKPTVAQIRIRICQFPPEEKQPDI